MEVIIPIPLEWGLWGEQGTCVPLCSRLECTWQRERHNFLIIFSWDVPVTTQHGGELFPAVLRHTKADGGNQAHSAPVAHCCRHPAIGCSPSVRSSLRARSPQPQQQPSQWPQRGAGSRKAAQPRPGLESARASGTPETGDLETLDPALQEMLTAPLLPPEEGRVENLLFPFCSVPPLAPQPVWYPNIQQKSSFLFLRVPRGRGW